MIGWGHRTSKCVQVFKLGWGHCTGREQLGWGHRTTCKDKFQDFTTYPAAGRVASYCRKWCYFVASSCKFEHVRFSAENPRWSRVWQYQTFFEHIEISPLTSHRIACFAKLSPDPASAEAERVLFPTSPYHHQTTHPTLKNYYSWKLRS